MVEPVIISLGSINVDFEVRVEREPRGGEMLLGHHLVRVGGGKAANVALIARRLGVGVLLLGQVGDDELSEWALRPLHRAGVDLCNVGVAEHALPGISLITVPPDGKKTIVLAPNANLAWGEADIARAQRAVDEAPEGSLLVVDYEVPTAVVRRVMEVGRGRGLTIILDPSPADRVDQTLLPLVDVVVPNPKEAEGLTGIAVDSVRTARRAGGRLTDKGAGAACVKLAEGGCIVVRDREAVHVAPVPVNVVDATGAGDAFAGALAVALLEAEPLIDAACFAAAASHVAVTGYGSQQAYPTRRQLEPILSQLRGRIRRLE
jgi:ribokinase